MKNLKVQQVKSIVNERVSTSFKFDKIEDDDVSKVIQELLKNEFADQGEFYADQFGITRENADLASWHPTDREFSRDCEGWKQFLQDHGKLTIRQEIKEVDLRDLLFEDNG